MKSILFGIIVVFISADVLGAENTNTVKAQTTRGLRSDFSNQDEMIEKLLTVSGIKNSLKKLEEQIVPNFKEDTKGDREAEEFQSQMQQIYTEAFLKDGFVNRLRDVLKENYDERRYEHMLQLLSTPLSMRMVDIESANIIPEDFQNFVSRVASQPLSPDRVSLIQRMDSATHTSELFTNIAIASIESNAIAMSDDCKVDIQKIKSEVANERPEIEKANRSSAQVMLAFTYRDVSDADLSAYLKTYEYKDSRLLQSYILLAIEEQYRSSIEKVTQGIRQLVQIRKPKKTMFAPKCN